MFSKMADNTFCHRTRTRLSKLIEANTWQWQQHKWIHLRDGEEKLWKLSCHQLTYPAPCSAHPIKDSILIHSLHILLSSWIAFSTSWPRTKFISPQLRMMIIIVKLFIHVDSFRFVWPNELRKYTIRYATLVNYNFVNMAIEFLHNRCCSAHTIFIVLPKCHRFSVHTYWFCYIDHFSIWLWIDCMRISGQIE